MKTHVLICHTLQSALDMVVNPSSVPAHQDFKISLFTPVFHSALLNNLFNYFKKVLLGISDC